MSGVRVAVTGVCASGKTTLVKRLQELGIDARNVAQEHSGVPSLWARTRPDVLVLLDAGLPTIKSRRPVPWGEERLAAQRFRLRDARAHADLFVVTDGLTREEVADKVLECLLGRGLWSPSTQR